MLLDPETGEPMRYQEVILAREDGNRVRTHRLRADSDGRVPLLLTEGPLWIVLHEDFRRIGRKDLENLTRVEWPGQGPITVVVAPWPEDG